MLLPDSSPRLRVTILAGPNRALRGPIVEQLIAELSPQVVTVLSFDREWCTIERNPRIHFRRAESKRIKITQPGLVVPFRADLFIELHAIARERSADHVLVELDSNDELPTARDSLVHRFPGGIDLRSIVRLTRSILVMPGNGLFQWFWTDAAAAEPQDTADTHSEGTCSQGHSLSLARLNARTPCLSPIGMPWIRRPCRTRPG